MKKRGGGGGVGVVYVLGENTEDMWLVREFWDKDLTGVTAKPILPHQVSNEWIVLAWLSTKGSHASVSNRLTEFIPLSEKDTEKLIMQ